MNTPNKISISGIVLLMFMVAIVATSCSKKPVTPPPPPAPIIGTWSVSKIIYVETGKDVLASRGCEAGAVSTFNADGIFSSTDSACNLYIFSGSWTLTADQLVVTTGGQVAWRGKIIFTPDNKSFTLDMSAEKAYIYTFKKQ